VLLFLAESSVWADGFGLHLHGDGCGTLVENHPVPGGVEAYYIFVNDKGELETFATEGFNIMD
jgi:hypothetical protein